MTYTIKVQSFEGPLEVLLRLIEERRLSVNEISLAEVTQGFFEHLRALEQEASKQKVTNDQLTAFLVISATLVLIKSKSLLPGFYLTKEEEEDVSDLTSRLEEYKKIKELSNMLSDNLSKRRSIYSRNPFIGIEKQFIPPKKFNLTELPIIMKRLLEAIPAKEILPEKKVKKVISLEKKISELETRIQKGMVNSFNDFVGGKKEKTEIIVSFLALLELIKLGIAAANQNAQFSNISIEKNG